MIRRSCEHKTCFTLMDNSINLATFHLVLMLLTLRVEVLNLQRNGESKPYFPIILDTEIHHVMKHIFYSKEYSDSFIFDW